MQDGSAIITSIADLGTAPPYAAITVFTPRREDLAIYNANGLPTWKYEVSTISYYNSPAFGHNYFLNLS